MRNFALIILSMFATIANCQTIHWLVFADTNDNHIGHLSMNSRIHLFHDFIDVTNAYLSEKGINIDIHDISGESLSPNMCKEVISNLKCGSDDIVFFYYIGHGYNTVENNSPFPLMNMGSSDEGESISLSWVHESMKKKNPRLLITIGMCSNILYENFSSDLIMKLDSMNNICNTHYSAVEYHKEEDTIGSLFMNYKGNIIVASTSLSQSSIGDIDNGDIFTCAFVSSFEDMQKKGNCDWFRLLKSTQQIVEDVTEGKQKPIWNIEYLKQENK